jgi:ABC-2 type transport system permease protein
MAWTFMFLLLPVTCVYYPVSALPSWLQVFAWMLPPTYVFEGMRALVIKHVFHADLMVQAFALNVVLFTGGVIGFLILLRSARREGTLLQGGD